MYGRLTRVFLKGKYNVTTTKNLKNMCRIQQQRSICVVLKIVVLIGLAVVLV